MDKPTVYIETSIVSYLAARPSRDPVTLRNQQLTHEWWNTRRHDYALFTSRAVVDEAAAGDAQTAQARIALLAGVERLPRQQQLSLLADEIYRTLKLPPRVRTDAAHIAFAAAYGVTYLLTWNCKHIANPALRRRLEWACRLRGFSLPVLCTPETLLRE
ncbi:MAG: type II toxin-antitoxin system VapC family toxin [Gemmatimonadetes bacterium]|nr:type II toxin-antitoxin system VapC family toxin [Gemmatimonadota bacterium]